MFRLKACCHDWLADGRVMVWGRSDYGQLGLEPHLLATVGRCSYKPAELAPLRGAHQVRVGVREARVMEVGVGEVRVMETCEVR